MLGTRMRCGTKVSLFGAPCSAAQDPSVKDSSQDWSLCMNGTRNEGAVKGAVDEFAHEHGLQSW